MLFVLLILLPGVRVEEATPSSLLSPRNFNHHPFDAVQFLKSVKPTKKGPILFPNDGPPPPPTPLIVTSRPLIESIRRSELNPNNTIQAQSQVNQVAFRPDYLSNLKDFRQYELSIPTATPVYYDQVPYAELVKKQLGSVNDYNEYGQRSAYLPIYGVIAKQANHDLKKHQKPVYEYQERPLLSAIYRGLSEHSNNFIERQNKPQYDHQVKPKVYRTYDENNDAGETSKEYNHGENYAFSYAVRDRKTGDDFSHSQQSSGSATNGEYRVRLPDGRMQIVSYTADENGYKADVRYDDQEERDQVDGNRIDVESNKQRYQNNYADDRFQLDDRKIYTPAHNRNIYKERDNIYADYSDKLTSDKHHENNDRHNHYILPENNDYLEQYTDKINDKTTKYNVNNFKQRNQDNDYYHYDDATASKEYKDYSSETDYQPYKSKYSPFTESNNPVKSTVKPSYEELKDLFVNKLFLNPQSALVSSTPQTNFESERFNIPFVSSTISPNYDSTTENVVVIGTKKPTLFTNIRNILTASSVTPSPVAYSTPIAPVGSTPSSYLISTITNLKNKISLGTKPQLSNQYIDKINKYLSYQ